MSGRLSLWSALALVVLLFSCGTPDRTERNEPRPKDAGAFDARDVPACARDCRFRECGPDPVCGESCGTCSEGTCDPSGQCTVPQCERQCGDRECGPDPICGLSCGQCQIGTCELGRCTTLGAACDPYAQSTCAATEKCAPAEPSGGICVTAGLAGEGDSCTPGQEGDECARGFACVSVNGSDSCVRICDPDLSDEQTCPIEGSRCVFVVGSIGVCSPPCDPYLDDCQAGMFCASFFDERGRASFCVDDGALGSPGDPCQDPLDCSGGATCVTLEDGSRSCLSLCNPSHACTNGECVATFIANMQVPDGGVCLIGCVPDCTGLACGPDPICGVGCGSCGAGETCDQGQCCAQDCSGRSCGPDPVCGQSCGTCSGNSTCDPNGQCTCIPQCGTRQCGLDPICGTSCGTCNAGEICNAGSCCAPSCGNRTCGPDPICGTSCGTCGSQEFCEFGQCQACTPTFGSCSDTAECCEPSSGDVECRFGTCEICAPQGYLCNNVFCCTGLFCNPAGICNGRDCSELGQDCFIDNDCCDNAICDSGAGFTCQQCRGQFVSCTSTSQCCSGLSCQGGSCQP